MATDLDAAAPSKDRNTSFFMQVTGKEDGLYPASEILRMVPPSKLDELMARFFKAQNIHRDEALGKESGNYRKAERDNYRALIKLGPGSKVRYRGRNGDGVNCEPGMSLGQEYALVKGPWIYTPNGSLSMTLVNDQKNERVIRYCNVLA